MALRVGQMLLSGGYGQAELEAAGADGVYEDLPTCCGISMRWEFEAVYHPGCRTRGLRPNQIAGATATPTYLSAPP